MIGAYKRSKFLAEEQVRAFAAVHALPVVIVNPSTPIGENDIKPTPTGKIIVDFLNGKMPAYLDTGLNLVDVRDVAHGHLLAMERGSPAGGYILGHQNLTLREDSANPQRHHRPQGSAVPHSRTAWPTPSPGSTRRSGAVCSNARRTFRSKASRWPARRCSSTAPKRCANWACRNRRCGVLWNGRWRGFGARGMSGSSQWSGWKRRPSSLERDVFNEPRPSMCGNTHGPPTPPRLPLDSTSSLFSHRPVSD